MTYLRFLLTLACVCSVGCAVHGAEMRALPYAPGQILAGLEWTSEPHYYPGIQSDMHWQTWGADDAIYSVDGDGNFFGTGDYYASLSRTMEQLRVGASRGGAGGIAAALQTH